MKVMISFFFTEKTPPHFLYSASVDGFVHLSHFLVTVNNAATNTSVMQSQSLGYILRTCIAWSCSISIFHSFRNIHGDFHVVHKSSHSHQQSINTSLPPYFCQALLSFICSMIAIFQGFYHTGILNFAQEVFCLY